jgi:phosphatidylserine/phosphatidylglycerophosphate/cardiolipin synthase-like enzyme
MAVISTGNLLSLYWGSNYRAQTTQWLTDPMATCAPPNPPFQGPSAGTNCQVEWGTRDFAIPVTDPASVAEISRVFFSDLHCGAVPPGTTPSRTNTNQLLGSRLPLAWSNGSLQAPEGQEPVAYPSVTTGYSTTAANSIQGNVRRLQLDLIKSAKSSLRIYNEEMEDPQVIAALVEAAQRLGPGRVRIVMTYAVQSGSINYGSAFAQLAAAGASIVLNQYEGPWQLYIHAKAMVADGTDAWVGSTNIGQASMDDNRELGIMITSRSQPKRNYVQRVRALSSIITTFDRDFADRRNGTPWAQVVSSSPLATALTDQISASPISTGSTSGEADWSPSVPVLCGPIPMPASE